MQFDEYPDAIDQVRVLAEVLGITADPGESLGERDSVDVTQSACPVCAQGAGRQLRSDAGDSEPRPFLVRKGHHRNGNGRHHAAFAYDVDRRERRHHSQWTVERAAVRDRVEV